VIIFFVLTYPIYIRFCDWGWYRYACVCMDCRKSRQRQNIRLQTDNVLMYHNQYTANKMAAVSHPLHASVNLFILLHKRCEFWLVRIRSLRVLHWYIAALTVNAKVARL